MVCYHDEGSYLWAAIYVLSLPERDNNGSSHPERRTDLGSDLPVPRTAASGSLPIHTRVAAVLRAARPNGAASSTYELGLYLPREPVLFSDGALLTSILDATHRLRSSSTSWPRRNGSAPAL